MRLRIGAVGVLLVSVWVFPRYKGGYINLDKVKDRSGTMHALLNFGSTKMDSA